MMRVFVMVAFAGLLVPSMALAQAPVVDPIRELLTEVRALRIAMERSATVGARIQLLVARVQLQEQRIAELSHRAAAVRNELSKVEAAMAETSQSLRRTEGALERGAEVDKRKELEGMVEFYKAKLVTPERRRQDLLNEEALLPQQLSADQGRWTDVNNQLDQLERSLTPNKP